MSDIRDGERLTKNGLGKLEAYRQPDGEIALWDGERHVMVGPNWEGLRIARQQLALARKYAGMTSEQYLAALLSAAMVTR